MVPGYYYIFNKVMYEDFFGDSDSFDFFCLPGSR